jgi:hypothetical protein
MNCDGDIFATGFRWQTIREMNLEYPEEPVREEEYPLNGRSNE